MSKGEADVILTRIGIKLEEQDNDDSVYRGRGGFAVVLAVAVFSSLAGLLMGLDIGYIAGVKSMATFSRDVLDGKPLTDVDDSMITMVFGVGAAIACFPPIMSAVVHALGRKGSVIAGGCVFSFGSALQAVAWNVGLMVAGRLIAGFSVGLLSGNAPVYVSEIAPPEMRGALVTGFQFAITVGIMLAFLLALLLEDVTEPIGGWRWVIASQLLPGLLLVIGGIVMPGSPRYLVSQGRYAEALKTLISVRSSSEDVRVELAQICREHEAEEAAGRPTWREFLSGDSRKLLSIGVGIQLLGQLCGMNAFMYNGPMIFQRLFESEHAGRLFTVVAGIVNIFATIPAVLLMDRCGRTTLLKWSAIGMTICSAVLASVGDMCFQGGGHLCGGWAKWTATLAICGFIFNFAYGWGGTPWVYCAEMFPLRHRTKGVGATTDANWVGNIIIAFLPPIMFHNWGFNCFWFFVFTDALCYFYAARLPETKDKSLEEITLMFKAWFHQPAEGNGDEDSGDEK